MRKKTRSKRPLLIILAGLALIAAAVAAWWFDNQNSTPGTSPTAAGPAVPYPDVPRVSVGDAKAALDLGEARFVDVRSAASYQQGHIPGAISIPLEEIGDRLNELDPTDWIITYCT